jgi:hypothetical protein
MRRLDFAPVALAAALFAGVSCAGAEPPPADVDSATAAPVEAEPDVESSQPVIVQQAQESRIGRMQLLGDPQSGTCVAEGDPAVAIRYTFQGDWPLRTVRLEASDTARGAALRMLEVQSTERAGAFDETETIYVLFDGSGGVQQGTRRYYSAEQPPAREERGLMAADSAQLQQLAQQIFAWCRRPSGAR